MGTRLISRGILLALIVGAGVWLRTLQPLNLSAAVAWPWPGSTIVTLYFAAGGALFPLSRRMPSEPNLPRAVAEALVAGPPARSRLTSALPRGTALRSIEVSNGVAHVDVSAPVGLDAQAVASIVATLTRLPDVSKVALSVDGATVDAPAIAPLLYYPSGDGLVAVPTAASGPRDALTAFLTEPSAKELVRMPSDAQLLDYDFDAGRGLLSLSFAYTPSIRMLALERPDRMRFLLLGLIATLTGFPEVRAVRLDFGGQSRLGLGECSDLLRTPQPRPTLLNDERLLGR